MRRAFLTAVLSCSAVISTRANDLRLNLDTRYLDPDKVNPALGADADEQLAQELNDPLAPDQHSDPEQLRLRRRSEQRRLPVHPGGPAGAAEWAARRLRLC